MSQPDKDQLDFASVLSEQSARWPVLQPQDAAKLLFQHAYGPEHALPDPADGLLRLRQEWMALSTGSTERLTPNRSSMVSSLSDPLGASIGNGYARLHLRPLADWLARLEPAHLDLSQHAISDTNRHDVPDLEQMNRYLSRKHLQLRADHLQSLVWRLFVAAASWTTERSVSPEPVFARGLAQVNQLAQNGQVPFTADAWHAYCQQWAQAGYPVPRHTDAYRIEARPAYRIVEAACLRFLPLLAVLETLLAETAPDRQLLVAIDGPSGSGKSHLGSLLGRWFAAPVLAMDDFFLRPEQKTPARMAEPGGNLDRERFGAEVLQPLRAGKPFRYQAYDCQTQQLGPPRAVQPGRLTIIEGSYSHHPDFRDAYDLTVFLLLDDLQQRQRILKRNGAHQLKRFMSEWIPLENRYFAAFDIRGRSDLVLPGD